MANATCIHCKRVRAVSYDERLCHECWQAEHAAACRYLGNDLWDCGKVDNNPF